MFTLPVKPDIKLKPQHDDARYYCVLPMRVCYDKALTSTDFRMLCLLASYCSNNGFTFVSTNTLALRRGTSRQSVSKQLKKLVNAGYVINVRKGYKNIRGALRRIVFDARLTNDDVISISNTPLHEPNNEAINMIKRINKTIKATVKTDALTRITFEEALLVVQHSLITDTDILTLERLIATGITLEQLKQTYLSKVCG